MINLKCDWDNERRCPRVVSFSHKEQIKVLSALFHQGQPEAFYHGTYQWAQLQPVSPKKKERMKCLLIILLVQVLIENGEKQGNVNKHVHTGE